MGPLSYKDMDRKWVRISNSGLLLLVTLIVAHFAQQLHHCWAQTATNGTWHREENLEDPGTSSSHGRKQSKIILDLGHIELELSNLPPKFRSSLLPREPANGIDYPIIGKIEPLPAMVEPASAESMGTIFNVITPEGDIEPLPFGMLFNSNEDQEQYEMYPFNLKRLLNRVDAHKETFLIVGGFLDKAPKDWQLEIAQRLHRLHNRDVNAIIVGWNKGNQFPYHQARANTRVVARQMTIFLFYLASVHGIEFTSRQFLDRIHIIGHSLGAHIAGFVGQDLGGQLGRITALDPAGPFFSDAEPEHRLDRSDARLVLAFHSNADYTYSIYMGILKHVGHLDLYPNGGKTQPGCPAIEFYKYHHEIVREHYISMLDFLVNTQSLPQSSHLKLLAYPGIEVNSYESFRSGQTFIERCPSLALDVDYFPDSSQQWADLKRCSVSIDLVSETGIAREDYSSQSSWFFDSFDGARASLYYYTFDRHPYISDHSLVKLKFDSLSDSLSRRSSRSSRSSRRSSGPRDVEPQDQPSLDDLELDVSLALKMASNNRQTHKANGLKLHLDQQGHYHLSLPVNSVLRSSLGELIELERNNFFEAYSVRQKQAISEIFPVSIAITLNHGSKPSRTLSNLTRNWLFQATGITRNMVNEPRSRCWAVISAVRIQPLTSLSRPMVAIYTTKKQRDFKIVQLERGQALPRTSFGVAEIECLGEKNPQMNVKVYLDKVAIGR